MIKAKLAYVFKDAKFNRLSPNCSPSSSFCSGKDVGICCFSIRRIVFSIGGFVAFLFDIILAFNGYYIALPLDNVLTIEQCVASLFNQYNNSCM